MLGTRYSARSAREAPILAEKLRCGASAAAGVTRGARDAPRCCGIANLIEARVSSLAAPEETREERQPARARVRDAATRARKRRARQRLQGRGGATASQVSSGGCAKRGRRPRAHAAPAACAENAKTAGTRKSVPKAWPAAVAGSGRKSPRGEPLAGRRLDAPGARIREGERRLRAGRGPRAGVLVPMPAVPSSRLRSPSGPPGSAGERQPHRPPALSAAARHQSSEDRGVLARLHAARWGCGSPRGESDVALRPVAVSVRRAASQPATHCWRLLRPPAVGGCAATSAAAAPAVKSTSALRVSAASRAAAAPARAADSPLTRQTRRRAASELLRRPW